MTERSQPVTMTVYLDGAEKPIASYRPPATLRLDTTQLDDGDHELLIVATEANGATGKRRVPFTVRNGPGITVTGLRPGSLVHGSLDIKLNAFSGDEPFDPESAESRGPIPVWTWVFVAIFGAWALWYGLEFFQTPPEFAKTPTYAPNPALAAANEPATGTAAQQAPVFSGKSTAGGFDYAASGATGYATNCSSCHGAEGAGVPNTFPPLAGDPVVTGNDPAPHLAVVLKGLHGKAIGGSTYSSMMPPFAQLSDQEIAAIIDHERTSWGNHAPIITPGDVKRAR
jgi:mono/diheme cytochrome c family protein